MCHLLAAWRLQHQLQLQLLLMPATGVLVGCFCFVGCAMCRQL